MSWTSHSQHESYESITDPGYDPDDVRQYGEQREYGVHFDSDEEEEDEPELEWEADVDDCEREEPETHTNISNRVLTEH